MKRLRMAIACFVLAAPMLARASDYPGSFGFFYGGAGSFKWTENLANGRKLLDETGVLYSVGYEAKGASRTTPLFGLMRGEAFFGEMDYDGQVQSGYPVKTDSRYFGMDIEGGLGVHFGNEKALMAFFAELGWKWWDRDIEDSTFVDNTGTVRDAIGYSEMWSMYYAKIGAWGSARLSDSAFASLEAGILIPLSTENEVDLYDVTVEPDGQPSPFAELGLTIGHFRVSAFYESLRFDKSTPVRGIYQPESKLDLFGGRIGVSF